MEPNPTTLETVKELLAILEPYRWPLLILFILLYFQEDLQKALHKLAERVKLWKTPLGDVGFQDLPPEKPIDPSTSTGPKNWGNVNNVFWIGHDLMWTIAALARNSSGNHIVRGLKQSLYHVKELPLSETPIKQKLERLLSDAQTKLEKEWTEKERFELAKELRAIIDEIGRITELHQKSSQSKTAPK